MYYAYQNSVKDEEIASNKETIKKQGYLLAASEQSPTKISWVKSDSLILLDFSESFVKYFLEPYGIKREDFIGYSDFKVFPKAAAKEFREDDRKALECFCPVKGLTNTIYYKGDSFTFYSVKYPVIFENGDTGVAGEGTFVKLSDLDMDTIAILEDIEIMDSSFLIE